MAKRSKRTAKGRSAEPKRAVSLPPPMPSGDFGATGQANRAGIVVELVRDVHPDTGERLGPNMKRARRIDMVEHWLKRGVISTAQWNTAIALRAAWERTEQAPGTDYARPKVDSSPKPDQAVAIQIDRVSKLNAAWARVRGEDRELIYHCVVRGLGPSTLTVRGRKPYHGRGHELGIAALRMALDVASCN